MKILPPRVTTSVQGIIREVTGMGVAFFIVLDKKKPGFDTLINGKAVARESEAIARITKGLKLADMYELTSFASMAAEFRSCSPRRRGRRRNGSTLLRG